jgi:hypothetical protein
MSIEQIFHCDWRECDGHVLTASTYPSGSGFITATEHVEGSQPLHFCSWDFVLRYAGEREPVEHVPWDAT